MKRIFYSSLFVVYLMMDFGLGLGLSQLHSPTSNGPKSKSTAAIEVLKPDKLVVDCRESKAHSAANNSKGAIKVEIDGGQAPYAIAVSGGRTFVEQTVGTTGTYTFNELPEGEYTIQVTDGLGEILSCNTNVTTVTTVEYTICEGDCQSLGNEFLVPDDEAISKSLTGCYYWAGDEPFPNPTNQTQTVCPEETTYYTLFITNQEGEIVQTTTYVVNVVSSSVEINPSEATICPGETVELSAPFGYSSYAWSTGESLPSIVVGSPGTYSLTVTDANGCQATGKSTVFDGSDYLSIKEFFEAAGFASVPVTIVGDELGLRTSGGDPIQKSLPPQVQVEDYADLRIEENGEEYDVEPAVTEELLSFVQDLSSFELAAYITSNENSCSGSNDLNYVQNQFEQTSKEFAMWFHVWENLTPGEEGEDLIFIKVNQGDFYEPSTVGPSHPPGHPVFEAMNAFSPYVLWSFVGSNNTGTIQFCNHIHGNSTDPFARQKAYGAIGEGLFGQKLLNTPVGSQNDLFFSYSLGGFQVDLLQSTLLYRLPFGAYLEQKVRYTDYEGNPEQNLITVLGANSFFTKSIICYEVKTISPDNSKQQIFDYIANGVAQVLLRLPLSHASILVINKEAWDKLYNDTIWRPQLLELVSQIEQVTNTYGEQKGYIWIEKKHFTETRNAYYALRDLLLLLEC